MVDKRTRPLPDLYRIANDDTGMQIDLARLSSVSASEAEQHVIASKAKQSLRLAKGLLRRQTPRNDRLKELLLAYESLRLVQNSSIIFLSSE
jgi:hypothetical protein